MGSTELDNLVGTGQLHREAPNTAELAGLLKSGNARLADARNTALSLESRFDLAYNAAHALSLAAPRRLGYRSESRCAVFQTLSHTLGTPNNQWQLLSQAHGLRNRAEYEGRLDPDETLVNGLIEAATAVQDALRKAGPPPRK